MDKKARVIAYYLPQFHPIPENDAWWGKGFTEWTNVAQAKSLFRGHLHPRVPADLGFYDLRMPEIREAQAELARETGIEGFCYWHYWFGNGKMLLERPFQEVLNSGKPDFPFCLGWANHSWTSKTWQKGKRLNKDSIIQQQYYLGEDDDIKHFNYILKAFQDKRYIRVDNKPIFVIWNPSDSPHIKDFIVLWNKLAQNHGMDGIHFVAFCQNLNYVSSAGNKRLLIVEQDAGKIFSKIFDLGFDAINSLGIYRAEILSKGVFNKMLFRFVNKITGGIFVEKYKYGNIIKHLFCEEDKRENVYPAIIPNYDRSPRAGKKNALWYGSTPELFKKHIETAIELVKDKQDEHKILFLKSWNEWAETNYMEPDIHFGKKYLDALKAALINQ
jgi:hypothetical protein